MVKLGVIMKILGIETSCDETAASVIEDGTKIISSVIATSSDMHAKTGGVIPEVAARQQVKSILPVITEAIKDTPLKEIDAIAVTVGPGLIGSLLVGVETAKTLSLVWNKPLIPVNHLIGHIYANWLTENSKPEFPALALVVSGGHTDLILMKSHTDITWISGTRDDAAGEAFDKTARLLNLPYPGGPNLSKLAQQYLETLNPEKEALTYFPRPLANEDTFDWSFSGLKTSVLKAVQNNVFIDQAKLAAEIQEAIVDSLVTKVFGALEMYKPKSFLLAGGVAANNRLREKFVSKLASKSSLTAFHVPDIKLCTDNAAYIAACSFFHNSPKHWSELTANPNLTIVSKV